jgi:hypothetical protein
VKIKKWTPYFRVDGVKYQTGELFYVKNDAWVFLVGIRFQLNFLSVVKLEFQHQDFDIGGKSDKVTAQVAIGF